MGVTSDPSVSVVICAYTEARWDRTIAAIASVRAQRAIRPEVVVVVDHNETLRHRLTTELADVRVVPNGEAPGLSGGRNSGMAASTGKIVAFLDDDAEATHGWLARLVAPFDDPTVAVSGGRIDPAWDERRPAWFPEELDWIVGCTYRGMPTRRAEVRNVIGAGMAFRRSAYEAAGGFHHGMGRGLGLPLGGEETELCIRIRRLDPSARVVYVPEAVIRHHVPRDRARPPYLLARSWAEGLTKARLAQLAGPGDGLATERRYLTRVLPAAILRELGVAIRGRRPEAFGRALAIVAATGAAAAAFAVESVAGRVPSRARPRPATAGRPASDPETKDNQPLRILQVTARYAPFVGGIETHTMEVARRLVARGHRVTVATTDATGELPRREWQAGVEIRRVRAWPRDRDWYFAPGLLRLIGAGRWDAVHLQGVHTLVPPMGALAAILGRRPFVLTFHSGGHSSRLRTSARGLQWRLLRPFLRPASALVGVSRFEVERFARELAVPAERIQLIRNGAEAPPGEDSGARRPPIGDKGQERPTNGTTANAERRLILSLGRLERYKGHQRIIAAMPAVLAGAPDVRLHVAGSGPYERELQSLVASLGLDDAVTVAPIPRHEVGASLARASLVALLSEYEAHPVAVMEAVAARRRVLVADTTGFRELAEEGLVRAIPIDEPAGRVAAAILEELAKPPPDAVPGLQTWDDTTNQLEGLYRRIAGRR